MIRRGEPLPYEFDKLGLIVWPLRDTRALITARLPALSGLPCTMSGSIASRSATYAAAVAASDFGGTPGACGDPVDSLAGAGRHHCRRSWRATWEPRTNYRETSSHDNIIAPTPRHATLVHGGQSTISPRAPYEPVRAGGVLEPVPGAATPERIAVTTVVLV